MTIKCDLPLPPWLAPFSGPSAWIGRDMAREPSRWLRLLTPAELDELEAAARHFEGLSKDIGALTRKDFPLPHFSRHLAGLRHKMIAGNGVEVLRGLSIQGRPQSFAATIFCGIGAHLGVARSQNAAGHILGHVRDIGADAADANARIYQTSQRQTFHTDSADLVGLMCLQNAKAGGLSLLVSAMTIYNRMREQRPDLLTLLFDPIATDRRGEVPAGGKPFTTIPVFSWHQGHLTVFYQRQYIHSAQRFPDATPLTPRHIEALDMFDSLANDKELHFSMQLQPGDMQFVYNHSQLHDRTAFTDWPDAKKRRHLLRLWLSLPGDRSLPPVFAERYGSTEIGNRGGIIASATRRGRQVKRLKN